MFLSSRIRSLMALLWFSACAWMLVPSIAGAYVPLENGWILAVAQADEQQEAEHAVGEEPGVDPGGSTDAKIEEEEPEEPIIDSADGDPVASIGKKYIRFHMWDGAVVGGDVSIARLLVKTEFGSLEIPIEKIQSFYPGLDSFPERKKMIDTLVEQLGDRDYDVRERAHRKLREMGLQLRNQLDRFDDGGSAERNKHLTDLRKELNETLEDMEEEEQDPDSLERAMIDGDKVNTPDFSVVGKIQQPSFEISSKYGQLTIRLQDIRFADRSFNQPRSEIRKSLAVPGETFFQREPKSARIRVNKGDRITIRASGTVNWTNWNNVASPEGLQNQGSWQGIAGGALCARIGKSGEVLKIGSKESFVAKKSGVLYLAIAMKDSYANNSSYRWEGEFKTRIVVEPAEK